MVIFVGTQFQDEKSGDLIEIIHYCRHHTKSRLVNTIVWCYKNGMSAHRYFANIHEEAIWLTKTDKYYSTSTLYVCLMAKKNFNRHYATNALFQEML